MTPTNNMQRVFDYLRTAGLRSTAEIATALHFTEGAVSNALRGLRRHKCIRAAFDGVWRYALLDGARCPDGHQGRKRAAG